MPQQAITMRKLKEILRLKYGAELSHRQIAASLKISPGTVSTYANRAKQLGIESWPLEESWDDIRLEREFLDTKVQLKQPIALPNFADMQRLLKRKENTLEFLWHQYSERHPDNHYSYNHYCRLYRAWRKTQQPSMRQTHLAGEKLFIDYCGRTIDIIDPDTGEIRTAQVFTAVLGASNYTYAEATYSQQLEDWCMSHVRAFEFFGGVPEILVPDNLKSAVTKACIYEPDLNPTYQQLANHYNVAVVPARPRKPKDKSKAELGVQVVTRWIISVLKQQTFYSLGQLNSRISELLTGLNNKPFQKLPGCRRSLFEQVDQNALRALPKQPYRYTHIKTARVHLDYHVEVDKHYYSVPHQLLRKQVEVHLDSHHVALIHQGQTVAKHLRSYRQGHHTTLVEHMPEQHKACHDWSPGKFKHWANQIGKQTLTWVTHRLEQGKRPEQAYRACMGLLSLANTYGNDRLEKACIRGDITGANSVKHIRTMLKNNLEDLPEQTQPDLLSTCRHDNIRGKDYYH